MNVNFIEIYVGVYNFISQLTQRTIFPLPFHNRTKGFGSKGKHSGNRSDVDGNKTRKDGSKYDCSRIR